ncbi:MAG: GNAT family N-acetyltransferase [Clostridium sp.]|uniref:GNAT family N-acetyltransferase n=1 Tax=Clostridium sp. TaxID=1506 RepID=UPI003033738A
MNKVTLTEDIILQSELPNGISIRQFLETDFPSIQLLYEREGWMTFIKREKAALNAWKNSSIALVVVVENMIIGLLRGLTDGEVTTYIAEIIIDSNYRGNGLGKALIDVCHNLYPNTRLDLLSTEGADEFYKKEYFKTHIGLKWYL